MNSTIPTWIQLQIFRSEFRCTQIWKNLPKFAGKDSPRVWLESYHEAALLFCIPQFPADGAEYLGHLPRIIRSRLLISLSVGTTACCGSSNLDFLETLTTESHSLWSGRTQWTVHIFQHSNLSGGQLGDRQEFNLHSIVESPGFDLWGPLWAPTSGAGFRFCDLFEDRKDFIWRALRLPPSFLVSAFSQIEKWAPLERGSMAIVSFSWISHRRAFFGPLRDLAFHY